MPFLNGHCPARRAYGQATFTYAAHLAMLQGILPSSRERIPFYNRYCKQLIRIANRPIGPTSLITFAPGTEDVTAGFRSRGYKTIGIGAMEWFRHGHLQRNFDFFTHTGIHADRQVREFEENAPEDRPFFALINFGETHAPYRISDSAPVDFEQVSPQRLRGGQASNAFDAENWARQIECCHYLDGRIARLVEFCRSLQGETVFVVCGDHGECFGEEGQYGHGFYHPKVMEVPLAIFDLRGELKAADDMVEGKS